MTTVDHLRAADDDDNNDIYDPDDVGQHSPPFQPVRFNLEPSLSPPPNVHLPSESPESSPAASPRRKGPARPKYHPSQGDAVLVSFMAGGNYSDIARDAGQQPLASDHEAVEEPMKGGVAVMVLEEKEDDDEGGVRQGDDDADADTNLGAAPADEPGEEDVTMAEGDIVDAVAKATGPEKSGIPATSKGEAQHHHHHQHHPAGDQFDLKALAAGALAQTNNASTSTEETTPPATTPATFRANTAQDAGRQAGAQALTPDSLGPMEATKSSIPSITTLYVDGAGVRSPDVSSARKHEQSTAPHATGELPPILHSPGQLSSSLANGNGTAHVTLPSISDQLGDINHLPEPPSASKSTFSQSPPGRPPPQFAPVPGHGSPPKSPNDPFVRRELPSPGRANFYPFVNNPRRPSQTEGQSYTSPADCSGNNTETPSTDQSGSTPATIGIDRMSIDGITNPQIGGFQCTYPGCTAQPFQTQYLLNSHANVHSSNRPHYCSVKGCPRSEGGKGFKRKNEMIRHGLVHDSPGYVCPFCPDREHKYPRPDNLQRHVRVHHVDKDKDDPQLREVLSQRPEGPSRGRRRRGGTT